MTHGRGKQGSTKRQSVENKGMDIRVLFALIMLHISIDFIAILLSFYSYGVVRLRGQKEKKMIEGLRWEMIYLYRYIPGIKQPRRGLKGRKAKINAKNYTHKIMRE